jgi:hypothetical protein
MTDEQPSPEENPFKSPQATAPPPVKSRPLSMWAIVLATVLSLVAGYIAFGFTCSKLFSIGFSHSLQGEAAPRSIADYLPGPYITGVLVGGVVACGVWILVAWLYRKLR